MMTFGEVLQKIRENTINKRQQGTKFEELIKMWFLKDSRYKITEIWLWDDFPYKYDFGKGQDVGIDLVAKTDMGEYWAIQCKFYAPETEISKDDVDTFLSTSGRSFNDNKEHFSACFFVSTTSNWSSHADESIKNQTPPVTRISIADFEESSVDWEKLWNYFLNGGDETSLTKDKKKLFSHQQEALQKAVHHFVEENNDRGKLIMACGTGKTFTSLKIVEKILEGKGLVLFLVPSISLLNQTLSAWTADSQKPIRSVCICSDCKASKRSKEDDSNTESIVDLSFPASTNPNTICKQLKYYRNYREEGLLVVFSTYQSIGVISQVQKELLQETDNAYGEFDFIICDEAHRTTGAKGSTGEESEFVKVHHNDFIKGKKRIYMTATPRIYGDSVKKKVEGTDCILYSMDDEQLYGKEFYRIDFAEAVDRGLLTDYKVLVLTGTEETIPESIMDRVRNPESKELNYDDTSKLIGVINGLSKKIRGDNGKTREIDPSMMRRAVAFCHKIGKESAPGTSKNTAYVLPMVSKEYTNSLNQESRKEVVHIQSRHVDGSMNAPQRNEILFWLKSESDDPQECRIVTNVRCLSEGVDVPALDAVIFLSARNSQIDVVQSVGRVMRNFRKGQPGEKRYGYIIIPIVVPIGVSPEEALNDNERYRVIWDILNALRSHDKRIGAEVNRINLNQDKSDGKVLIGAPGFEIGKHTLKDKSEERDLQVLNNAEVARQLEIRFGKLQSELYAKLVEHCGNRAYLETWAKDVGDTAEKFKKRIEGLVLENGRYQEEFNLFLASLQNNLNSSVTDTQAIEMLAQHMITKPVFDVLFEDYRFVDNNSVSKSMQTMVDLLQKEAFGKDLTEQENFYKSVKERIGRIDNYAGKQTIVKNLYESFFSKAFKKTVDTMGIVYTPVECVDFILHSVDDVLKKEFDCGLTTEGVHVLDPFVGTGTFITRLLQSDLIEPRDLVRKYQNELHCNELVLLAYYISDVNIESTFHEIKKLKKDQMEESVRDIYLPYDGICLTDTFQMDEIKHDLVSNYFPGNSKEVEKQRKQAITVIIGNPPYSIGQKSANDNAQNLHYPKLEKRIEETYAKASSANLQKGLHDSYIKAFRWASDRIAQNPNGGVIGFISNGAWLDGMAQDGFRKCLEEEFSSIYIVNLRGNCRTQGEARRKEGAGIFGEGSRTPISITILVKKPGTTGKAKIYYHDIGDYLDRETKLKKVSTFGSILSGKMEWQEIVPNQKNDWLNQRGDLFDTLLPLIPEKKFDEKTQSFFTTYSLGVATNKDVFLYNSSSVELEKNISAMIDYYNRERENFLNTANYQVKYDKTKIVWTDLFLKSVDRNEIFVYKGDLMVTALYRPYYKQMFGYQKELIQRTYQQTKLFPTPQHQNLVICVSGKGSKKEFSTLICDTIVDLNSQSAGAQCFPLYWYEDNTEKVGQQQELFQTDSKGRYTRKDGISDWIKKQVWERYGERMDKEDIFYYVYGILHSAEYREQFANELKLDLPKIPLVEDVKDFLAFVGAGKALAKLHLDYEKVEPCPCVKVIEAPQAGDKYAFYSVEKMRYPAKGQRGTILYNLNVRIEDIPAEAYEYVVNGKSAIDWVMENYQDYTDKDSLIRNNPNDWSREHGNPRYILDLLLSVINLSLKTMEIVKTLPKLKLTP